MMIINWKKIDTYKFWPGLFFTICHPVYAWNYDRNCYGSFLWRCNRFFTETLPSYTPFSKASRWLAHMLVQRICDTKYITPFYVRKRSSFTTYYLGKGNFGRYILYKCYYKPIKVKVPQGLKENCRLNNETWETYADKPTKTKIASGWVFRKKTAIALYKKIVVEHSDLYISEYQDRPDIANPYLMENVINMKSVLYFGNFNTEEYFDSIYYEQRFNKSRDNIEKLWCYVAHLLSCPNDFMAHEKLSWIFRTCDSYLYYKEMKTHPEIDYEYNITLKNCGEKAAKKWQNQQIKAHSKSTILVDLDKELQDLQEFYESQPFDYYRV